MSSSARADITFTSFSGSVIAEFDTVSNSDSSIFQPEAIVETAADNNSVSESDLDWSWDGSTLSGSSDGIAEKTVAARPGGDHCASSNFSFSFGIDEASDFVLEGFWGTNNLTGVDDSLSYSLIGPSGVVETANSAGTTGVASDVISSSGTLPPGSYTLTFESTLKETINNMQTGSNASVSGWTLSEFSLVPAAVPEPSGFALLAFTMIAIGSYRHRKNLV